MDPSKKGAALAAQVPGLIAHNVQRQTVPVNAEVDDQQEQRHQERWRDPGDDAQPPPYETTPSTTPAFMSRPSVRELGDADGSRSSCSSFGGADDTAGLLGGGRGRKGCAASEGYLLTPRPKPSREQQDDNDNDDDEG